MAYKKNITDEELEKEIEKAFKEDEVKRDHCGTALPSSKEIGVQRENIKVKKE
jgi:hypothetical protein